jgi:hypothetical protein
MDLEGSSCGLIEVLSEYLRSWKKIMANFIRIDGGPARVQTDHLSNTYLGHSLLLHRPAHRRGIHSDPAKVVREWNPVWASDNYNQGNASVREGGPQQASQFVSSENGCSIFL